MTPGKIVKSKETFSKKYLSSEIIFRVEAITSDVVVLKSVYSKQVYNIDIKTFFDNFRENIEKPAKKEGINKEGVINSNKIKVTNNSSKIEVDTKKTGSGNFDPFAGK